ncbi:MAG TPA: choice-of-anchor J domain-containing protein [Vulgatibacter sp.]
MLTTGLNDAKVGKAYSAGLQRSGGSSSVTWSLLSGTNHAWLTFDPATGLLSGTPTAADVGPVEITVRAGDPGWASNYDEKTFAFEVIPVPLGEVFEDDFSACSAWTMFPDWQCGNPSNIGPTCRSPGGCLATNLSGIYSNSLSFSTSHATRSIDLTNALEPSLTFWAWVHTEGASWDAFNVKFSTNGGATFSLPPPEQVSPAYTSASPGENSWGGDLSAFGWRKYTIDMRSYAGSNVLIRFAYRTDSGGNNYPGVYIDDVNVSETFVDPLSITSTVLPGGFPSVPWAAGIGRRGGSSTAQWSIVSGPSWMQINPQTGTLSGIPMAVGDEIVTVRVEEPLNPANFAEATYTVRINVPPTGPYYVADFTSSGGWTLGTGEWELGVVTSGPGACRTSAECLATRVAGNYNDGATFATSTADSPDIDLTDAIEPKLSFWAWVRTEGPSWDIFNVKISRDGGPFLMPAASTVSPPYNGNAANENGWGGSLATWRKYTIDLTAFEGSTIRIRFAFRSDGGGNDAGVYVDDLVVANPNLEPLSIVTNQLPNAVETRAYPTFALKRSGGTPISEWSISGGSNQGWLSIDPATGVLSGMPTAGDVGPVTLIVRIEQPGFPMNFAEKTYTFEVEPLVPGLYLNEKFGICTAWALRSSWQCGNPTAASGPSACRSPGGCLSPSLAGNYSDNLNWADTHATSPELDLTTAVEPKLEFFAWVWTEGASWDAFNVKISQDGGAFVLPTAAQVTPAYTSSSPGENSWGGNLSTSGWRKYTVDISQYVGSTIRVRFAFRTDGSGNTYPGVFIDDLRIFEPDANPLAIMTSSLPSGFPSVPWSAQLAKDGGTTASVWSIVSGPAWMQIDPTGRLFGTPPAMGTETVTVRVEEPSNPGNFAEATLSVDIVQAPTGPYFESDFTAAGGWTVGGEWEQGVPTSGPGSCLLGGECLATRLATVYNNSASFSTSIATSPTIDLTDALDPVLSFWVWMVTESGWDGFNLKVSVDGGPYTRFDAVTPPYNGVTSATGGEMSWHGNTGGWAKFSANLSAFAGHQINLRFAFGSDSSGQFAGVYIDDLRIANPGWDQLDLYTIDLPELAPVGIPFSASFVKTGGTPNSTFTFTPTQNASWLSFDPVTRRLSGTPTAAEVGPVTFTLRVEEPGFPANFSEDDYTFDVVEFPAGYAYLDDFEDMNRWTLRGDWEHGTPTNVGPAACRSGSVCLGTRMDQEATPGLAVASNYVSSPPMIVPAGAPHRLTFWAWVETSNAQANWFQVQVLRIGESTYTIQPAAAVAPAYVYSSFWGGDLSQLGWRKYSVDLSAYAGQNIRVALIFNTASGNPVGAGAYVDDVAIEPAANVTHTIVENLVADAYPDVPYTHVSRTTQGVSTLAWSIVGGVNHAWLSIDPATGRLTGTPTLGDIGPVSVVVRAEDPANPTIADERELEFEVSGAQVHYAMDFEGACPNGWTLTLDWQCGTPTSGPNAAYGGANAMATNLTGDYASGRSWSATNGSNATSPDIDLSGASSPVAYFRMWLHTEAYTFDGVRLEVSDDGGATFLPLSDVDPVYRFTVQSSLTWGGNHTGSGYRLVRADLSAFAGSVVNLRFALATDGSGQYPGAYIDDLVVVEGP